MNDCEFEPFGEPRENGARRYKCKFCPNATGYLLGTVNIRANCDPFRPESRQVGKELKMMFAGLGFVPEDGCNCEELAAQMNEWGPKGCREHRSEIVWKITTNAAMVGLGSLLSAGIVARQQPWFRLLDPVGSFVDEAIRRAEAKATGS